MLTKICPVCGDVITSDRKSHLQRRKYCSRKCAGIAQRTRVERPCSECGVTITINAYALATQQAFFCSRKCMGMARSRMVGADNPTYKGGDTVIPDTCAGCGETFYHAPYRKNAKFCSKRCKGIWMSRHITGANHPQYKGGRVKDRGRNWQFQSRLALERDGYRCQICNKSLKRGKGNYGIHHIRKYREFNGDYETANQLQNLISLCRRCHTLVESGKLACPRPLL